MAGEGIEPGTAYKAGLLGSTRPARLFFENRVVFPVCDARGRVLGFGGRKIGDEDGPKYINTRETAVFRKHDCLFGLNKALVPAQKSKRVIAVEGYIDVIRMAQAGLPETVAGQGSSVDLTALDRAFPFVQRRYFLLDGDAGGQSGNDRMIDQALRSSASGKIYLFTPMPAGQDPDSFVGEAGPEAMHELLEKQSVDLAEAVWRRSIRRAASLGLYDGKPEAVVGLIDEISEAIETIEDAQVRSWYETYMSGRVEVTYGPRKTLQDLRSRFA